MKNTLQYYRLSGLEARDHFNEMAKLRITVFKEYPYLYSGTLEYEKGYLETYFKSEHSMIFLVKIKNQLIGMTTCIKASDETNDFKNIFTKFKFDPDHILYMGESLLLPEFRGMGLGKLFFKERENFGVKLGLRYFSFCSVVREIDHPLKPQNYQPLNSFWQKLGYAPVEQMLTEISWKDINQATETKKFMQYWIKENLS